MRCGRDGIGPLRDHSRTGYVADDLGPRQMPADTGLCALAHLDLDCRAGFKIRLMYAETSARHLDDRIRSVYIEVFMQTAFTGVIKDAELGCRSGKRSMGVIADGTVAHCREHNGHREFNLGLHLTGKLSVCAAFDLLRLLAEEHLRLHRFPQGIDRRVGNLGSVDQNLVPVNRERLRVTHGA